MHKVATDLRTRLRAFYTARVIPAVVDVPNLRFIAIDGSGAPGSTVFEEAVQALYSIAFTAKFRLKREGKADFKVMPLEGLWWVEGIEQMSFDQMLAERDSWQWTLMIAVPEEVDRQLVKSVQEELIKKEKPGVDRVRLVNIKEGQAVQILHVGPYSEERRSIDALHAFAAEKGFQLHGRHHEIYLGDPRRSAPGRLKTILRHPVK